MYCHLYKCVQEDRKEIIKSCLIAAAYLLANKKSHVVYKCAKILHYLYNFFFLSLFTSSPFAIYSDCQRKLNYRLFHYSCFP